MFKIELRIFNHSNINIINLVINGNRNIAFEIK